jgi:pyridoxal phosphate enzyme (YggS family)
MIEENLHRILKELPSEVKLVAVSKFHPFSAILSAYQAGQRRFGENRPQEFQLKALQLPQDIEWHFIGHLQTNKLKLVLPYASLVESIDSVHLLEQVELWGAANGRAVDVLLELHLGAETTKGGLTEDEIEGILQAASSAGPSGSGRYPHVNFRGLMGMATNTADESVVEADFVRISRFKRRLDALFPNLTGFTELSIGMSNDWRLAVRHGATIVRIGTSIFGPRTVL